MKYRAPPSVDIGVSVGRGAACNTNVALQAIEFADGTNSALEHGAWSMDLRLLFML
jgi:hypothetical protein